MSERPDRFTQVVAFIAAVASTVSAFTALAALGAADKSADAAKTAADAATESARASRDTETRLREREALEQRHDEAETMASIMTFLAPAQTDHATPTPGEIERRRLSILFAADFACEPLPADAGVGPVDWIRDILTDIADQRTDNDVRYAARAALDRVDKRCSSSRPGGLDTGSVSSGPGVDAGAPGPIPVPNGTPSLQYDVRIVCSPDQKKEAAGVLASLQAALTANGAKERTFYPYVYNQCLAVTASKLPAQPELRIFGHREQSVAQEFQQLASAALPTLKIAERDTMERLPAKHYLELWLARGD